MTNISVYTPKERVTKFEFLKNNQELADTEFIIGNERIGTRMFYGIRSLFACHSSVLKAMLYGRMSESNGNEAVRINDLHPDTFEWLMSYCYGLDPKLTHDNIVGICHASDKYLIQALSNACVEYILNEFLTNQAGKDANDSSMIWNLDRFLIIINHLYKLKLCDGIIMKLLRSNTFLVELSKINYSCLFKSKHFYDLHPNLVSIMLFNHEINLQSKFLIENIWIVLENYCQQYVKNYKLKDEKRKKKEFVSNENSKKRRSKAEIVTGLDDEDDYFDEFKNENNNENGNENENENKSDSFFHCNGMIEDNYNNEIKFDDWKQLFSKYFLDKMELETMHPQFFVKYVSCHDNLLNESRKCDLMYHFLSNKCEKAEWKIFSQKLLCGYENLQFDLYNPLYSTIIETNNNGDNETDCSIKRIIYSKSDNARWTAVSCGNGYNSGIHRWRIKYCCAQLLSPTLIGICTRNDQIGNNKYHNWSEISRNGSLNHTHFGAIYGFGSLPNNGTFLLCNNLKNKRKIDKQWSDDEILQITIDCGVESKNYWKVEFRLLKSQASPNKKHNNNKEQWQEMQPILIEQTTIEKGYVYYPTIWTISSKQCHFQVLTNCVMS